MNQNTIHLYKEERTKMLVFIKGSVKEKLKRLDRKENCCKKIGNRKIKSSNMSGCKKTLVDHANTMTLGGLKTGREG